MAIPSLPAALSMGVPETSMPATFSSAHTLTYILWCSEVMRMDGSRVRPIMNGLSVS